MHGADLQVLIGHVHRVFALHSLIEQQYVLSPRKYLIAGSDLLSLHRLVGRGHRDRRQLRGGDL